MEARTGRMLIFTFVLLGTFVTLLGLIPPDFYVETKEYSVFGGGIPSVWNGVDLLAYNFTEAWNYTLLTTDEIINFDVGGRNLQIEYTHAGSRITLFHRYGFGLIWKEAMDWFNREGTEVSQQYIGQATIFGDDLDEDWNSYNSTKFRVICKGQGSGGVFGSSEYFEVMTLFGFNQTAYNNCTHAWNNDDLDILVGIEFDQSSTQLNAFYLLTQLLLFNTVEVFGSSGTEALALNFILTLPIFATIAVIAFVVITELIPF